MEYVLTSGFRSRYAEIFQFLRRNTPTRADAEDMTQTVFAQVAEHLGRASVGGPTEAPLPLLYAVARRRLIDDFRRRARYSAVPIESVDIPAAELEYAPEIAATLRIALDRLPDPQRRVVVLRLIAGRPFSEIAAELGTTEAACKMRFRRGLDAVRTVFEQEGLAP